MLKGAAVGGSVKHSSTWQKMVRRAGDGLDITNIATIQDAGTLPDEFDFFVQLNLLKKGETRSNIINAFNYINNSKVPRLVAESAVFRNTQQGDGKHDRWYRLVWNSYYFDEGLYPTNCPPDRWNKLQSKYNLKVNPWNDQDGHILICLQKLHDSSLNRLYETKAKEDNFLQHYVKWLRSVIEEIRSVTERKIVVRPHPNCTKHEFAVFRKFVNEFTNCFISGNFKFNGDPRMAPPVDLHQDMQDAKCVVVYNSLTAVEAVMLGKPTYCLNPSAVAWPVSRHNLKDIELPWTNIDRRQWLYNLAYCQWRVDEIQQGIPWFRLRAQKWPKKYNNLHPYDSGQLIK